MNRLLATLFALIIPLAPAQAYWEYGHETVAQIAETNMPSKTRGAVQRLLRAAPLLGTPQCPLRTMKDVSVWADCIKGDRLRWGYTNSWHYQNVDICKPFDLKSACADGNCVSAQIDRNVALLKKRTLPAHVRLEALAFLVHFVGDLHQPLHAGDHEDQGGNDLKASYGVMPGYNLHSVWDGLLADRALSAAPPIVRRFPPDENAPWAGRPTRYRASRPPRPPPPPPTAQPPGRPGPRPPVGYPERYPGLDGAHPDGHLTPVLGHRARRLRQSVRGL